MINVKRTTTMIVLIPYIQFVTECHGVESVVFEFLQNRGVCEVFISQFSETVLAHALFKTEVLILFNGIELQFIFDYGPKWVKKRLQNPAEKNGMILKIFFNPISEVLENFEK